MPLLKQAKCIFILLFSSISVCAGTHWSLPYTGNIADQIEVFAPDSATATGQAVLVLPGGGYHNLSYNEKELSSRWLQAHGIAAFALSYRMPEGHSMWPLEDAWAAMKYIRANADKWNLNPHQIGVMGFSAGGHLAAMLSVHNDAQTRPDYSILFYPPTSMHAHRGSRVRLLGKDSTLLTERYFSAEDHVSPMTPPTLFFISSTDATVNPQMPTDYVKQLLRYQVYTDAHFYPEGKHGFCFKKEFPYYDEMTSTLARFLQAMQDGIPNQYTQRLGTYNVRVQTEKDTDEKDWNNRKEFVARLIRESGMQVVGLQEIKTDQQLQDLKSLLPEYDFYYWGRDSETTPDEGEKVAIAWQRNRYKADKKGYFFLNEHPTHAGKGWDAACKRIAVYVRLTDLQTKQCFIFCSTHLDHKGHQARIHGAQLIKEQMERSFPTTPVVVVGDMNTKGDENEVIEAYSPFFTDSRSVCYAQPKGCLGTWAGWSPNDSKARLDYLLVRRMYVVRYETLQMDFGRGITPSDHFPVIIDVRFPNYETTSYKDANTPLDMRVEDALSQLTLDEKIDLIHGWSKFMIKGVPRLGIPELYTSDGPHGVRPETSWTSSQSTGNLNDSCTAFPCELMLAATWNRNLSYKYGKALGEEMRYRKKDVALGPGVNIYRTPLCSRNMEYLGEDPYLSSVMATQYIQGLQENGVAACVKHFALNNQESNRHSVDVQVSDRALYEIYLPAFKAAVQEGGALSIMASYNLWNGQHCCHNERLLKTILRDEWGFEGTVISDWNGTHDTREAIYNGLDIEMGTKGEHYFLNEPYKALIDSGVVTERELNEKVRHSLRLNFQTAMNPNKPWGSINTEAHHQVARQVAQEGIVLLKNDKLLPLSTLNSTLSTILVVGENAIRQMTIGGGSSTLKAQYEVSPLDAIRQWPCHVEYARGYVGDTSRTYDGYQAKVDLSEERSEEELFSEAVDKARQADVVIFIGGLNKIFGNEREGQDRIGYELPYNQSRLIEALADANKNLVVVNISGNAVEMPWADKVPAIVHMGYAGSEAGNALSDVLLGKVNPSGHLPFSWMKRLEDYPAHKLGTYTKQKDVKEEYKEDIFVGYRYTDLKNSPKPLFAFGHGLSYTTFTLHDATLVKTDDGWLVSTQVTNTGHREGKSVVQLYVGDEKCSVKRPVKELKHFEKCNLQPGETQVVQFLLTEQDLSFFAAELHQWKVEKGVFQVYIGFAADNILQKIKLVY